MRKTWRVVLGAFLALTCGVRPQVWAADAFTLKGTVVDVAGQPVAGATVESYARNIYARLGVEEEGVKESVTTGSDGGFKLELPGSGLFVLCRKPGLAPAWLQFWNVQGDVERKLVLLPPSFLAGIVVDEADKPLAGAEVSVLNALMETQVDAMSRSSAHLSGKQAREHFTARSGVDGRFRIEGFPTNATAALQVKFGGKALREERQEAPVPSSLPWSAGQEDIRLVLEPAGSIEGTILVEGDATPVPIARLQLQPDGPVYVFGATAPEAIGSGVDGRFRIPDVAAGSYRVRATFGTNTPPEWVAETEPVSVDVGQVIRDVQIKAIRGGVLNVKVVGEADGKPWPQVNVSAYGQNYQAPSVSDADGLAVLRLPPGQYSVHAFSQNSMQQSAQATVETGKTNQLEIALPDPKKVTGLVRGPDGQPAVGAEVRIVGGYMPSLGGIKTDAEGKFEMEWNPRQFGRSDVTYCVMVRDLERNLAVAQDVDEDSGPLELRLEPAMSIAGKVECDGKPVTNATAAVLFRTGSMGMYLQDLAVGTNAPGRFEIPALPLGRRYGFYVTAPGYGRKSVNEVDSDEAKRMEVDTVELKPANLKLAGQVLDADDKPVRGVYVSLNGEGQPFGNVRTDRDGHFRFEQVCGGSLQLSASAQNSYGNISAEGGDTNVVLRLGERNAVYRGSGTSKKLKGSVTDPEGNSVSGAQVAVFPFAGSRGVKTDAKGEFSLSWTVESWQLQTGGDTWLVIRDLARNLAVAEVIGEGVTNLSVQLKSGMTVTGRVEGPDGAPLTNAQVGVWLTTSRMSSHLSEQLADADAQGNFEIRAVPHGPQYRVYAKAKDHGKQQVALEAEAGTNQVTLPTFVLKVADQVLAGQVVNAAEKPVSGVHVSLSGEDQPDGSVTTDSKGRFSFKVCEGQVRLFASGQNSYANVTVTAGDTNVVLHLTPSGSPSVRVPSRPSLEDRPLPDLTSVGFAADAAPKDKPRLLCLLDAEQRPSRRVARLLAEQHDDLKAKGVTVLAAQVASASAETLEQWTNSSPLPFAVGCIEKKSSANQWATGVASLPWLILCDADGKVTAEGFALDELDAKVNAFKK